MRSARPVFGSLRRQKCDPKNLAAKLAAFSWGCTGVSDCLPQSLHAMQATFSTTSISNLHRLLNVQLP